MELKKLIYSGKIINCKIMIFGKEQEEFWYWKMDKEKEGDGNG